MKKNTIKEFKGFSNFKPTKQVLNKYHLKVQNWIKDGQVDNYVTKSALSYNEFKPLRDGANQVFR